MNQDLKTETLALLEQFGQVILSGPPGTGKTRLALHVAAAAILGKPDAETLPIEKDPQFALVQFHPSYNYEDFVRGIQVTTDNNNNVVYETVNRVFGEMAERAAASDDPHVLVIDEINRANVSAVLGELIYGLEYRGKEVQTPYQVDGKTGLLIPENLQIIGTMNTADRTIGQIDYAVRRRFAFVHCPPQPEVVQNVGGDLAREFFNMVDAIFAHLSADHDKEDVCIGHSYFLADGVELANKIIYQVVPILREYLKDGVLNKEAKTEIDAIEKKARAMLNDTRPIPTVQSSGQALGDPVNLLQWQWKNPGTGQCEWMSLRRMILSLMQNYINHWQPQSLEELEKDFPTNCAWCRAVVLHLDDPHVRDNLRKYFVGKKEQITLPNGRIVVVCNQWGAKKGKAKPYFDRFREAAKKLRYTIHERDRFDKYR